MVSLHLMHLRVMLLVIVLVLLHVMLSAMVLLIGHRSLSVVLLASEVPRVLVIGIVMASLRMKWLVTTSLVSTGFSSFVLYRLRSIVSSVL